MTLQLLWLEYQQTYTGTPDHDRCYRYTQFCAHYHVWRARLDPVLRQTHRAGERAFVDYAGLPLSPLHLNPRSSGGSS